MRNVNKSEVKEIRIKGVKLVATQKISEFDRIITENFDQPYIYSCPCSNCTSDGFDISTYARIAIHERRIISSRIPCTGKLSSKYKTSPAQTCDGYIEFEIIPSF